MSIQSLKGRLARLRIKESAPKHTVIVTFVDPRSEDELSRAEFRRGFCDAPSHVLEPEAGESSQSFEDRVKAVAEAFDGVVMVW